MPQTTQRPGRSVPFLLGFLLCAPLPALAGLATPRDRRIVIRQPSLVGPVTPNSGIPIGSYKPHKPRVFGTRPRVTICVSPWIIRQVIRRSLPQIRRCYVANALVRDPKRAGKVLVRFTVNHAGRVAWARVQLSRLRDRPTERCLEAVLRKMRFPKLPGMIHVYYPFLFRPH